jgi:hypothetical protein
MPELACSIMQSVYDELQNNDDVSTLSEDLDAAKVTPDMYQQALATSVNGQTVVLKRDPQEKNINAYNKHILQAWEANLDLQFCLNAYACIHYMVSYITKDETQMGLTLKAVSKELANQDVRTQLKECAKAFLTARELSAQEVAYRLLSSLPMFKTSFTDVFIPTNLPNNRIVLLKSRSQLAAMADEDENISCTSLLDRYAARPKQLDNWNLATFAKWYKYTSTSINKAGDSDIDTENEVDDHDDDHLTPTNQAADIEKVENVQQTPQSNEETCTPPNAPSLITLRNDLGIMKKCKKPMIVRYHTFKESKEPEAFYHANLLLYIPWRSEIADLLQHGSYQAHYHKKLEQIQRQQQTLEQYANIVADALQQLEDVGPPAHAWDTLAPQQQQQHYDDVSEGAHPDPSHSILDPEEGLVNKEAESSQCPPSDSSTQLAIDKRPGFLPEDDYLEYVHKMNIQQREVFQTVLHWCQCTTKMKTRGLPKPDPLHLFVTGGAGTGKSFLITAIYQMAIRILQRSGEDPDIIHALLTAPTGTAAFNISGITLHSAFLLPLTQKRKGQPQSYRKLADATRNTLRTRLESLDLLIIDEISMVGPDTLLDIHNRLCEIKASSKLFGGISVVTFGDLYQLPLLVVPLYSTYQQMSMLNSPTPCGQITSD